MSERLPARVYFSTLLEINNIVANSTNPTDQFNEISQTIKNILPHDLLSVFSFNEEKQKLELLFASGTPQSVLETVNFKLGKGATLHAVNCQKPFLVNNKPNISKQGITSFMAIPILFQEKMLGVFSLGIYQNYSYKKLDAIIAKIITSTITNLLIFLRDYADSSIVS